MGYVRLHVVTSGLNSENCNLIWTVDLDDEELTPGAYPVEDLGALKQAAEAVRRVLGKTSSAPSRLESDDFAPLLRDLARRGEDLFLHLMPPHKPTGELSDVEAALRSAVTRAGPEKPELRIILNQSTLSIPWGFAFAGRIEDLPSVPKNSIEDMAGFLLYHFRITVAYNGTEKLPKQRLPSFRKMFALNEDLYSSGRRNLEREDADCVKRLDTLLEGDLEYMDWEKFKEAWDGIQNSHDSVWFVFGHSDGQRILLANSEETKYELLSSGLKQFFVDRIPGPATVFFLNGCRTAAPLPVPVSANFLKVFSQQGCYGFIGTEAEVPNAAACRYGTEFMWRLCQERKTVDETLRELLSLDRLFPHNMLYTCYAHRKFHFGTAAGVAA